jgi:hypothetical protein
LTCRSAKASGKTCASWYGSVATGSMRGVIAWIDEKEKKKIYRKFVKYLPI